MTDVLVLASDPERFGAAAEYAAGMVARLGGTLTAIHEAGNPPLPEVASEALAVEIGEMYRARLEAALHAEGPFTRWAQAQGVSRCAWYAVRSPLLPVVEAAAQWNDLIVVGRGEPGESAGIIGPILLRTRLPCIVVGRPGTEARLRTIAVAWNGSQEAIRALHSAMPLLHRAERVVLLRGTRREPDVAAGWAPRTDVAEYLDWAGVRAHSILITASHEGAGPAIAEAARAEGADLLVMGAYGRTRFSEWFLGGVTRHMLEHAELPLFLRH